MIEIKMQDLQVGQKYYIHNVSDKETHEPISRKYKAICTTDYSTPGGWYEFVFENVKGINTSDVEIIGVSVDQDRWGLYKFYLCERDDIIERVTERVEINTELRKITGDPKFKFY